MGGLLYANEIYINDRLSIRIPTVGEIIKSEKNDSYKESELFYSYYDVLKLLVATPQDYMVQLDDAGVDFTTLSQYDLFLSLFQNLQREHLTRKLKGDKPIPIPFDMVFKGVDFLSLKIGINAENQTLVLYNDNNEVVIDRAIHLQINRLLNRIHYIQPDRRKAGNEEARKYMIERARIKQQRAARRKRDEHKSQLEDLIVALVNTEQFKYNYDTVRDLTIYQFNTSLHQIVNKMNYDNIMTGYYSGTVDISKMSQDDLNWLTLNKTGGKNNER